MSPEEQKPSKIRRFFKSKWTISAIVLIAVLVGAKFLFFNHPKTYQFITVNRGSLDQTVSVTGNTTPEKDVSLAFGSSGIVARTYSDLGKKVYAGQVLAELNTSDLAAQLENAEAALTIAEQNASSASDNLSNVTAEQNALVAAAKQAMYAGLAPVSSNSSDTNPPPTISGSYTGTEEGSYVIKVYPADSSSGIAFAYSGLESGMSVATTNIAVPLGTHGLFITFPSTTSPKDYAYSTWTVEIPNKRWNGYAAALKNYDTALATRATAIANAEANVGTNNTDAVNQAKLVQAQANVDAIIANIQNAKIIAPLSGTVTKFDVKVGQFASTNTPLISIISDGGYEVDAGVTETDIGKVKMGDAVTMTLDAFPNETFSGKVFYVAPAETNTNGVITYLVKISFDNLDPRLKSGLTANTDIHTKHLDGVLILPQYAILQNDNGTFVQILSGKTTKDVPVTLGIQDKDGNTEIISGVSEGEQVINIGLKQ